MAMNFSKALAAMKNGKRVSRDGWNGKGMYVFITRETENGQYARRMDHIDMKAADGSLVIGWLASQTDLLANDWGIVEEASWDQIDELIH